MHFLRASARDPRLAAAAARALEDDATAHGLPGGMLQLLALRLRHVRVVHQVPRQRHGVRQVAGRIERLNVDSNGSGDRRTHKPRLDISGNSAKVCIDGYAPEGGDRVQFIWLKNEEADAIVAAKEFPEGFKGTPVLSCSVTPGRTYAPCAYFTTHGLWLGRSETA